MIAIRSRIAVAAALALALAGCSSAPTHFYTLVPPPSPSPSAVRASYLLEVLPVTIPAQVDQPQMVVRQGDDQVQLLESQQWIAPLGDEVRSAFAGRLGRDLGTHDVYGMPHPKHARIYRLRLQLQRFDSVPGRYALIEAGWSVRDGHGAVINCSSRVRETVGAGYAALVHGHQRAIARVADQAAAVVRAMAAGREGTCPAT